LLPVISGSIVIVTSLQTRCLELLKTNVGSFESTIFIGEKNDCIKGGRPCAVWLVPKLTAFVL
jgi:hypothetical protein